MIARTSYLIVAFLVLATISWAQSGPLAIRAGKVCVMDEDATVRNNVIVFVRDGLIEKIIPARGAKIPAGYTEIDHSDKWLVPGLIDCHNHTAGALSELNDGVWLTNPGLRTSDLVAPNTDNMKLALAGGVTTVLLIPGSGTNLSGYGTIARTAGRTPQEMIVRATGSLKIAQAGNPERYYFGVARSYMNFNLRQTLQKAQAHAKATGQAGPNATWDTFRGLFGKRFPVSVHTQIYQVFVKTLTMLHDEFGLWVVPDHSTFDSYKAAELVKERDLHVIVGPRCFWMDPADRTVNGCAARFWEAGVRKLGINTDAPVVPEENLTTQAAMAVRLGWETYPALAGLTRIPAEALGIQDRVGTIEVGKDADLCVWTGDPIDPRSSVELAVVQGRVAYEASKERIY